MTWVPLRIIQIGVINFYSVSLHRKGDGLRHGISDHGRCNITGVLRLLFYENDPAEKKRHTDGSDGQRKDRLCETD